MSKLTNGVLPKDMTPGKIPKWNPGFVAGHTMSLPVCVYPVLEICVNNSDD